MQYKGAERTAELRLANELLGQLAIEVEFRGVSSAELIAHSIKSVAMNNQFDVVLGQAPKRPETTNAASAIIAPS
jgi:hypothetical protein